MLKVTHMTLTLTFVLCYSRVCSGCYDSPNKKVKKPQNPKCFPMRKNEKHIQLLNFPSERGICLSELAL